MLSNVIWHDTKKSTTKNFFCNYKKNVSKYVFKVAFQILCQCCFFCLSILFILLKNLALDRFYLKLNFVLETDPKISSLKSEKNQKI